MGEHLPCKQGVKGSNPFISTMTGTARRVGQRDIFGERRQQKRHPIYKQ